MSQETIVNRVQQTSHFAAESAKLEPAPFSHKQAQAPLVIDSVVEQLHQELVAEKAQTAEAQRTGQVGSIEEPDDNIGNIAEPANLEFAKALLGLSQLDSVFKKQVITAFKHLGLDTRKFFSE